MSEWFLYSYLAQGSLARLVFVLLNLSRILLTQALIRLSWRKLMSPLFPYLSDCSETGEVDARQVEDREEMRRVVRRVVGRYEGVG
jgi:hypothetical protein